MDKLAISRIDHLAKGGAYLARLLAAARLAAAQWGGGHCADTTPASGTNVPTPTEWCSQGVPSPPAAALACVLRDGHIPLLSKPGWKSPAKFSRHFHPGWCEPRQAPLTERAAWRQHAERRAAERYDIQLLRRSDGRELRFDLHPGVQRPVPHQFDCKHSAFAPGAFDVEASGFIDALEKRFGRDRLQ